MSERRELLQPILLSIVIPIWAFDEAQSRTNVGPHWLNAVVCAVIALNVLIRVWRGRIAA
jgi:hypothetical protein